MASRFSYGFVRRNVVLITNGNLNPPAKENDANSVGTKNTFDIISLSLDDIDLAIVDLGVNLQSLNVIEALTHSKPNAPVIALVDGKDSEAIPQLHLHGAAAAVQKPFSAEELAKVIEAVCASSERTPLSADKWGHIISRSKSNSTSGPTDRSQ